MPQIVLTVLQAVFLILFYLFVARAVRAVLRDVAESTRRPHRDTRPRPARAAAGPAAGAAAAPRGAPAAAAGPPAAPAAAPGHGQATSPGAASVGASTAGASEARSRRPAPSEIVVHSPDGKPSVLPLDGREITFGRGGTSTVQLTDPYASERHARVYHDGSAWVVDDLGSTNGTFVNRARVTQPTPLVAGDQLGIGRTVVEVRK